MGLLDKIFSKGADAVVGSVGKAIDSIFTNDEERLAKQVEIEKVKVDLTREINRNMEAVMADTTRQLELEVQDRTSARLRESEFVKATGHIDYLMWVLALSAVGLFSYMVYSVIKEKVQPENRELIFHIFGIVEGFLLSVFSYFFGSSAGSRIKDMKPKS